MGRKVSGLAEPALLAVLRREAAELNQAGLVRMKRQRELLQPVAHRLPEAASVALMLEADDGVVGVPDHDHVARGLAPSPALSPEIEDIMEVDVREQRRDHRTLARPRFLYRHDPVFADAVMPAVREAQAARAKSGGEPAPKRKPPPLRRSVREVSGRAAPRAGCAHPGGADGPRAGGVTPRRSWFS